ncbi:unnamed protein product [Polarella glacialis]|uniref:Sugar phosphate transporter domain-containing protein n=1 Tax=Polarella glacialis TaxID=89957 RepID=A0A813JWG4_POLGL|nr:unnamed protein product [Polarella glacialis]
MAGSTVDANADARRSADLELGPAVGSWMICSVGMMIFNKGAIGVFPLECTLTGLQMAFTVLAMLVFCFRSIHIGSARDVLRWSLVAPFFTGMLLTSILALKNAPMTLVIVFRSLSPVLALAIERFYPNPLAITPAMLWAIAVMIAGTGLYASTMERDSFVGIQWVLLNMVFAVGDRLLQRLMLAKDQHPVDISKTGVTLLNNALGMLPLLVMAGYLDLLKVIFHFIDVGFIVSCFCFCSCFFCAPQAIARLQRRVQQSPWCLCISGPQGDAGLGCCCCCYCYCYCCCFCCCCSCCCCCCCYCC